MLYSNQYGFRCRHFVSLKAKGRFNRNTVLFLTPNSECALLHRLVERSKLWVSEFCRMSSDEEHNASGARCIKCGGRTTSDTNRMLICCEDECTTALHEECMAARAQLDVIGYFRCPKCAVKWINELCAQKEKLLEDSATKLANWISRAYEDSRMEVDDQGENSGASARRDFENVEGGERHEEREPIMVEPLLTVRVSDVPGTSNGNEGLGERVAEEENNGTRVLPESFSKVFTTVGRRRVFWTEDEIKALEEGVQNIWNPTKKNIPWEKILLAYKDRFHSSRTAANLKDKWKSMSRPKM